MFNPKVNTTYEAALDEQQYVDAYLGCGLGFEQGLHAGANGTAQLRCLLADAIKSERCAAVAAAARWWRLCRRAGVGACWRLSA